MNSAETAPSRWQFFDVLKRPGIRHGFTQRTNVDLDILNSCMPKWLDKRGFPSTRRLEAEQVHGGNVAVVHDFVNGRVPSVDGIATQIPNAPLVIRVADCGAVFFYDPVKRVIALSHSGRKGTEANITGETIRVMKEAFGTSPLDLIVQLSPCIRPPHYEVDFAAEIGNQARAAGVQNFHDCGTCTASNLDTYYSYRAEKGQTGRMWAVLMLID